jgi:hypothetical protein
MAGLRGLYVSQLQRGEVGRELDRIGDPDELAIMIQGTAENELAGYVDQLPDISSALRDLPPKDRRQVSNRIFGLAEIWSSSRHQPGNLAALGLSPRSIDALQEAYDRYLDSLPLSAAECRWLGGLSNTFYPISTVVRPDGRTDFDRWLSLQSTELITDGRKKSTAAETLVTCGWDWMRGAGAFEGNSTYEVITRDALWRIAVLFDRDDTSHRILMPEIADNFGLAK